MGDAGTALPPPMGEAAQRYAVDIETAPKRSVVLFCGLVTVLVPVPLVFVSPVLAVVGIFLLAAFFIFLALRFAKKHHITELCFFPDRIECRGPGGAGATIDLTTIRRIHFGSSVFNMPAAKRVLYVTNKDGVFSLSVEYYLRSAGKTGSLTGQRAPAPAWGPLLLSHARACGVVLSDDVVHSLEG